MVWLVAQLWLGFLCIGRHGTDVPMLNNVVELICTVFLQAMGLEGFPDLGIRAAKAVRLLYSMSEQALSHQSTL